MTASLLAAPVFRAVDDNGAPLPGALLQFYLTGTTTPASVYTSAALTTALSNPVVADSGGLFPAIYPDPSVLYRAQLKTSAGGLLADVDPVNEAAGEATQAQVNTGVATGVYVSPAKLSAWTGIIATLGYTPLNKAGDTATGLAITPGATPGATAAGYLGAPVNEQDAGYTLVLADAGRMVRTTAAGATAYTIPPSTAVAWPTGTAIVLRNAGAGTVTVTRGTSVILIGAGTNTNKDWTLAPYGMATIIRDASNDSWVISGVGVS